MTSDTETPNLQSLARTLAAIGFGPPLAHDQHPDVPLSWLGAHLRAAAAGPDPIPSLVQGMRTFLTALSRGDLHQGSPDLLANLQDAVEPVFHRLVSLAPRGVPPHSVALGLGALRSLVANLHRHAAIGPIDLADPLVAEEINHVGLLTSELDACERRRRLNESGNQVARLAAINVARNRTDTAGLPLH